VKRLILTAAGLLMAAFALPAFAEGLKLDPVTHEATLKECSACHMVYQPQMLPARSWEALMQGLGDHFGESAALDPAVAADITAYLTANAADANGKKSRLLRRLDDTVTPLRITEMPWWKRSHGEVSAKAFKKAGVGSAANCIACHKTADQGLYSEDEGD
jgi:hypothetical protein